LIKWVSYPITEALWEPKSNLTGATDIVQEYQELVNHMPFFGKLKSTISANKTLYPGTTLRSV
jgi:hypothetical protein